MPERNVFAPPKASLIGSSGEGGTREGKYVVVQAGSDLPPRCIHCNEPAVQPIKKRKLYWHTPWLYVLILVNLILYAIVAMIVRKSVQISPGLCEVHAARRKWRIFGTLAIAVLMVAGAFVALTHERGDIGVTLFLLAFLMLVIASIVSRVVNPQKITKEYAQIAGCKEPFLASIE